MLGKIKDEEQEKGRKSRNRKGVHQRVEIRERWTQEGRKGGAEAGEGEGEREEWGREESGAGEGNGEIVGGKRKLA